MEEKRKTNFLKEAMILSAAGLIVKIIGSVYRIILNPWVGAEGMGTYQMAYPIYTLLLSISTAGIPTAISKLMAERIAVNDNKGSFRVFKVSLVLLFFIGLFFSAFLYLGADYYATHVIQVPVAGMAIKAIAPAVFFVSIMSGFRGFFQGLQDMTPSAISQIVEQVFRVIAIFTMVWIFLPISVDHAAAGAASGPAFGGLFGLLTLLFIYFKRRKNFKTFFETTESTYEESSLTIMKNVILFALPITLGGMIVPCMSTIDTMVINTRLMTIEGMTLTRVKELYGYLSSYAGALVNFPPVITIALSASLVPAIAEAMALKNRKLASKNISTGIKFTFLVGMPCTIGMFVLATPICTLLYRDPFGGKPLAVMAFTVVFLTLNQTCAGILQGLGHVNIPVRNLLFGVLTKTCLNYVLVAVPSLNILGAALGSVGGYGVASILNLLAVRKYAKWEMNGKDLILKPLVASLIMGVCTIGAYYGLKSVLGGISHGADMATLLSILIAVVIYFYIVLHFKFLERRELLMLPGMKEERVAKLERINLFKSESEEDE